ncbi:MAG: ribosomal subunit interface protein [Candidatus Marinimicrobia bacterium]|nr:ribosomal subunit interface protein [Candidatus Neomarinimicrobiota bacterium]
MTLLFIQQALSLIKRRFCEAFKTLRRKFMLIEFTARHFHAPDTLREYAEQEVQRLNKIFDRITRCQIILLHENNMYTTEINLYMPSRHLNIKETTDNATKSIDRAVDKMIIRVKKIKEKMFAH